LLLKFREDERAKRNNRREIVVTLALVAGAFLFDPVFAAPLVYEGFGYTPQETLGFDDNGGTGFSTPWRGSPGLILPVESDMTVAAGSLAPSASPFPSTNEHADAGDGASAFRTMAVSLEMNANEDYFVSFLFYMQPNTLSLLGGVSFFPNGNEEVFFGWSAQSSQGFAVSKLGGLSSGDSYSGLETHFLVGKIQARPGNMTGPGLSDQLFLEAYAPGETVPANEPATYSVVGQTTENIFLAEHPQHRLQRFHGAR